METTPNEPASTSPGGDHMCCIVICVLLQSPSELDAGICGTYMYVNY